jgi:hypothetical protein
MKNAKQGMKNEKWERGRAVMARFSFCIPCFAFFILP